MRDLNNLSSAIGAMTSKEGGSVLSSLGKRLWRIVRGEKPDDAKADVGRIKRAFGALGK